MKKKIISMALVAVTALGLLTGCGQSKTEAGGDQLARIKDKGEIVIAMEGTWAPWTYHDETDKLVGFDVEIAEAIAKELGVKATFVEGEWDGLFAGLDNNRYDLVVNGVDVTDERKEKYDFSDPYCFIRTALIVSEDNQEITSFEDLAGHTTANSINSTYMLLAEQYGATVSGVDSLDETMQMVLSGRVDATLNAEVSFYDYMSVHPEAALKVATLTDEANLVAIPLRKGEDSASLRTAINEAIAKLQKEGTLSAISEKYFGSDITQK